MVKPGLEKRAGTAGRFTGVFMRYSKTRMGKNTVLLRDVYDSNHQWVCDHTWMHRTREMKELNLERGDVLIFDAVVKKYFRDKKITKPEDIDHDYGFERVKIIDVKQMTERPPRAERKPFKKVRNHRPYNRE